MVFKPAQSAAESWRKRSGHDIIPDVISDVQSSTESKRSPPEHVTPVHKT